MEVSAVAHVEEAAASVAVLAEEEVLEAVLVEAAVVEPQEVEEDKLS